jgi:hypothetical protein
MVADVSPHELDDLLQLVPNSLFFFDDHNTSPNILDDVFGLRPRYLLPIDVD